MIVSPFTPLFFIDHKSDGSYGDYRQTFATTDRILLQLLIHHGEYVPFVTVSTSDRKHHLFNVELKEWVVNGDVSVYFAELRFGKGDYSVYIDHIGYSEPFIVTDDATVLDTTTLIQYSMKDNKQRTDTLFFIDGMQYFFDFRVPGGFRDSDWTFSVESEQFVTQFADINQLYGLESTQKRFTLGTSQGCPIWFGEMLNRILVCSHVYFDGVKYCRKEANTPEVTQQIEGVNSFVFTQILQKSVYLDPKIETSNHLALRRLEDSYRATDNNTLRKI